MLLLRVLVWAGFLAASADATAMGALKLDNYTFDKSLKIPGYTILTKFDKSYAYGDKEDEFKALCKQVHTVPKFFIAEIPVQEYGDKENEDLQLRYGLDKEKFPTYMLFKGPENPETYDGKVTAADLVSWLRLRGIKVPAIGTIPALDEIVVRFLKEGKKDADIAAAKALAEGDHKEDPKAAAYMKIFDKVKDKGDEYITKESARIEKILKDTKKLTEEKQKELTDKHRILSVFAEAKAEL